MRRLTVSLAALVAAVAFAIPAAASAGQTFVVTSNGDEPDASSADPLCSIGASGLCTLRAAIEASNAAGGPENLISFGPSFDGGSSSTITPATALPAITSTAVVAGPTCPHGSDFGPCVGIDGPAGQTVLKVQASFSAVYNLSITGGSNGIEVSGSEDFITGNWVGMELDGSSAPNSSAGISVTAGGPFAAIEANQIRAASSGNGIQTQGTEGKILENAISGAFNGILISGGNGNLIEGNSVLTSDNSSLSITGNGNEVFGNEFDGSAFSSLFIEHESTGNRIGGDTAASENVFTHSTYSPIAIIAKETTQNEIARNRGSENGGGLILIHNLGSEPNLPNGGIEPPAIATASQSGVTGTAEPGAVVRVFRKASAEPGELESFLRIAIADDSGNWSASYTSQIPTGTLIAATQTNTEGGTSELAFATSAADPERESPVCPPMIGPGCGGGISCPVATGSCGGSTPRAAAPETMIAKKPKPNGSPTAKFKFTSTISGSSFECKLDKGKFRKCRSPKTYKKLKAGKHVFKVRAVSPAGFADPSPAAKKFTVEPS